MTVPLPPDYSSPESLARFQWWIDGLRKGVRIEMTHPKPDRLTWEEKLMACSSLADCSLRMRAPGNWYVDHRAVSIATGGMLEGRYGDGRSPEEAVSEHFRALTELKNDERVVIESSQKPRREVRWTGFMWQDWTP